MRPDAPLDLDGCAALLDVSRETLLPCARLIDLLRRWQRAINLVAPSTLADPWRRHILDSGQLVAHLGEGDGAVVDLGSGAGFPGLVVASLSGRYVRLIESDGRKARFLHEAARAMGAPVEIVNARIEGLDPWPAAVVTARALAPLERLLPLARPFLLPGSRCLFLKSETVGQELTVVRQGWNMSVGRHPSLSDPRGVVLQLEDVRRADEATV